MARGDKKELTATEIKKEAISKMLESLISGDAEKAGEHLHDYLQLKTREIIMGEEAVEEVSDEELEEQTRDQAFAMSGKVMDDKVKGDVKFDNGGKKTVKRPDGNKDDPNLDMNKKDKVKFKHGGKQPAKVLEPTPKPDHFDDGRDRNLGTAKS